MSTHPKASHHTHPTRGSVADDLARIEFTPVTWSGWSCSGPAAGVDVGGVFHDVGDLAGTHS
jgi:hypothetical protein